MDWAFKNSELTELKAKTTEECLRIALLSQKKKFLYNITSKEKYIHIHIYIYLDNNKDREDNNKQSCELSKFINC